ncbi:MAG: alpha/beta fold hydrolase [Luteimonas sp.]|nr:alpha/beta fold hydrolase [Luteimonas sp.]
MSYLDEGPRDGEVVVMVHGNPSWSYYWRHLVLGLRDRYRCIVPDHVGMGLSDKPDDGGGISSPCAQRRGRLGGGAFGSAGSLHEMHPSPTLPFAFGEREGAEQRMPHYDYTLQSRVDDLDALLRHLGIDGPVTLAVHDWGGMIGFGWALSHMPQVRRLVILNTAAFPLPAARKMPWQLSLGRDSRIGGWLIRRFNLFARGAARFGTQRRLSRDVRRAYASPYDGWTNAISTLRFMQDIPLREGDPAWPLVAEAGRRLPEFADRPAFIGWGLRDFVFDRHFLDAFRRALPQAEVHAFDAAGHYVLEDKHEVLVPAIREFLEANSL